MKANELNINNMVLALSVLKETENYLRDTTDINKAVSGRNTLLELDKRAAAVEKLIALAKEGSDEDLSADLEELVNNLGTYFNDTLGILMVKKVNPEGGDLLVLPKWSAPDESGHTGTTWGTIQLAFLHAVASRTNSQEDIKAFLDYQASNVLPKGFNVVQYATAVTDKVGRENRIALNAMVAKEFGAYLNVKTWADMSNAVEKLVNDLNAKPVEPLSSELIVALADFDRINDAVEALFGGREKAFEERGRARSSRERDDRFDDRRDSRVRGEYDRLPHYTRGNVARNPAVVLQMTDGKVTGVNFTGL